MPQTYPTPSAPRPRRRKRLQPRSANDSRAKTKARGGLFNPGNRLLAIESGRPSQASRSGSRIGDGASRRFQANPDDFAASGRIGRWVVCVDRDGGHVAGGSHRVNDSWAIDTGELFPLVVREAGARGAEASIDRRCGIFHMQACAHT
jgi:hypothetical protein